MGDYADMAVDDGFAEWADWYAPENEEANEHDSTAAPGKIRRWMGGPRPKVCNRCGEQMLIWSMTDDGWRLHYATRSGLRLHVCTTNTPTSRVAPLSASPQTVNDGARDEPLNPLVPGEVKP